MAADSVHYTELGYKNLSEVMVSAIEQVRNGTLTKSYPVASGKTTNVSGSTTKKENFFWRGFSSPVGHSTAKIQGAAGPGSYYNRGIEGGDTRVRGGSQRGGGSRGGGSRWGGGGWFGGSRGREGGRGHPHRGYGPHRGSHRGSKKYHPY
jgi:hypothetical protein